MTLQDPNMMPSSRLGCPLSLKTPNMGNVGLDCPYGESRIQESPIIAYNVACITLPDCVRSIIILRGLGHRNPQYT